MNSETMISLGFFACVAIIAALVMIGHHRYNVQRHQTLRALVDKGMEIPPQLLAPAKRPANPRSDLRRGILLVCAGLGIGLFLLAESGPEEAALGLIPIFVGIGYLIVARLHRQPHPEQVLAP